ncbi:MAG: nucleotide sugar dehydrogenase [Candidatus Limnocylindrales bacterium]|jgi:UDPglucose 6-dehydrogenase
MRVCVSGLWHLGSVTAACLAAVGHDVIGHDPDPERVELLAAGKSPIQEPGLEALLGEGLASGRLRFSSDLAAAARDSKVVWITHDTPVDDADRADPGSVIHAATAFFPFLESGSVFLVSSQLPVGSTRDLMRTFDRLRGDRIVAFAYSPENLRLGTAIDSFTKPERIVVGVEDPNGKAVISALLAPLGAPIEWMTIESAEMTKHALNAFLATSIVFVNEIATICESVGADVAEVVRALRGDPRVGQRAYLGFGTGYAGGTLGRDVTYLADLVSSRGMEAPLLASVGPSNRNQHQWVRRTLVSQLVDLRGLRIGIWGLTYKPGTDTLRRSASIELCKWLADQGAIPTAHDPAVRVLPADLSGRIALHPDALGAIRDADALVLMTPWPDYRSVPADSVVAELRQPVVIDPGRFLASLMANDPRLRYSAVGLARA